MEIVDTARGQGAPGASWVGPVPRAAPQGGSWKGPREPGGRRRGLSGPCPRAANSEIKPSICWGNFFQGLLGRILDDTTGRKPQPTLPSLKAEGAEVAGGARRMRAQVPRPPGDPARSGARLVQDDSASLGAVLTAGRRERSAKFPLTPQTSRGGQGAPKPGPEASGEPGSQGAGGTPTSFTLPFLCGPPQ